MGVITGLAIATNCFGACTKEDVPDKDYDFLIKQENQKDGIDLYKPKSTINYSYEIKCPLCKIMLASEERQKIQNILSTGSERLLDSIIKDYNKEADSVDKIDNIDKLEAIYKKMEEIAKTIEEMRFYKHTCTRNDICQRKENQDIYIDLCFNSPQEKMEKDLKVDLNKLKTDENYKNKYLSDRQIAYENHIRRVQKEQIEDEYRSEFEAYTFKKERDKYEWATRNVKDNYQRHMEFENRKGPMDIRFEFQASNEWYKEKGSFKYSGTKKKLLRFIQDLTGQYINDHIEMGKSEYKEFQKYILERDQDYYEYLDVE